MACGAQCNSIAARTHIAIFCWCINLFVWWHCLCSLTFKFLSSFSIQRNCTTSLCLNIMKNLSDSCAQCILQQRHSFCLLEIYDLSFVCPVNPSVSPNNSIKLVPFPHRINSMPNSNRYNCEWILCRKMWNNCRRLDLNVSFYHFKPYSNEAFVFN